MRYSTFEELASRFHPGVNCRLLNNLYAAYLSDTPTLGEISDVYGWDKAVFWVKVQIQSIDSFSGTAREGRSESIGELAQLFTREYRQIRLTEFMLFVARFKLGIYGRFYGSFDPITVGDAFRSFLKERNRDVATLRKPQPATETPSDQLILPEGYNPYTWYVELKRREAEGDEEAILLLKHPSER